MKKSNIWLVALIIFGSLYPLAHGEDSRDSIFVIGQDNKSIADYMVAMSQGKSPNGIMVYTAINDLRGLSQPVDQGAGVNYADELLHKYPQMQVVQIGLYMRYMLNEIVQGSFDKNIDLLGEWIKRSGKQVYLRIGYEFDNPDNEYDPGQYIKAYRYIVDRLKRDNVNNVYFVWHSIAWRDKGWPEYDPLKWYPGNEYVDWIGISFFDIKRDEERNIITKIAKSKNKPIMIAESSPFKQYTVEEKLGWIKKLFEYIKFNNVKFLSYINVNWDMLPLFKADEYGDARLLKDPILIEEWVKEINQFRQETN